MRSAHLPGTIVEVRDQEQQLVASAAGDLRSTEIRVGRTFATGAASTTLFTGNTVSAVMLHLHVNATTGQFSLKHLTRV